MMRGTDPLADVETLIARVYAYVAYRIPNVADAEEVVSATFERAVRYRSSYDPRRGKPMQWLVGIAKHCMNDVVAARTELTAELPELDADIRIEDDLVRNAELRDAVQRLSDREQELIALRFGADLTAREIGRLVGAKTNAVEVALHRALARLEAELGQTDAPAPVRNSVRAEVGKT